MLVNRADFLRVLRVVKSVEVNEVKFDVEGKFGISAKDGCSLLFGKGVELGQEVGFMDVLTLEKMLNGLRESEVNVELKEGMMTLAGEKMVFGYRLGQVELIEGYPQSKMEEFNKTGMENVGEFVYEDLARVNGLIKTLGVEKVSFIGTGVGLQVVVGDRKLFYGQVSLPGGTLSKTQVFLSSRLSQIFDVIDSSKIGLSFSSGEKGFLRISSGDWQWFIGALVE